MESSEYSNSKLYRIRHSLAHVMAQAVIDHFPTAKTAIGPAIDSGFYYDFDLPRPLTEADLAAIESRMKEIVGVKHAFTRRELSFAEAKILFAAQPYKLEMINDLETASKESNEELVISTYRHDTFEDLCRGPHIADLGEVNPDAFKLLSVAGAYWRGDEKRQQLQRIYGTAFDTKQELDDYLKMLEELERRDHRRLGKELDLYSLDSDLLGGGLVLWHPNGAMIRHLAETYWKEEHLKNDYQLVYSPHIGRAVLWQTSGHLAFYKDSMYAPIQIDEQEYYLKPMNCPFHILIYKSKLRSYREYPIRMAEMGTVYRYEKSGALHGLARVRGFTQDDAHHFVQPEKMPEEIDFTLKFCLQIIRGFGLSNFKAYLSTKPEGQAAGSDEDWMAAERALEEALQRANIPYDIDKGAGVFYGPKIDLKFLDAMGREWQLSTIQFDFNLPERFDVSYIGPDGKQHRPYMIHRALVGSMERFFATLIEFYAGAFPVWLAPVQIRFLPIADRHHEFCFAQARELKKLGFRAEVDDSSERLANKVRLAQGQKIPYFLVVGDKEVEQNAVAVRLRTGTDLGQIGVAEFIELASAAVRTKAVN